MAVLPTIGGDDDTWGQILDDFLMVSHAADGTLLPAAVAASIGGVDIAGIADTEIAQAFADTAGPAGPIGDGGNIPVITVGQWGEIIDISTTPIAAQPFTPLNTFTTDFTADGFYLCPVDLSGGSVAAALPDSPADFEPICFTVVKAGDGNSLTITCGDGTTFQTPDGTTTRTLTDADASMIVQYAANSAVWYIR